MFMINVFVPAGFSQLTNYLKRHLGETPLNNILKQINRHSTNPEKGRQIKKLRHWVNYFARVIKHRGFADTAIKKNEFACEHPAETQSHLSL